MGLEIKPWWRAGGATEAAARGENAGHEKRRQREGFPFAGAIGWMRVSACLPRVPGKPDSDRQVPVCAVPSRRLPENRWIARLAPLAGVTERGAPATAKSKPQKKHTEREREAVTAG